MTASPHTIGHDQPLLVAHQMMREHGVRHLPVLEAGKLVGIVSERDVALVEVLRDVDPRKVEVSDAMSQQVYAVPPEMPLGEVAREMADKRYGCVVVMRSNKVVGVFTTVDGMRVLSELLASG